MAKGKTKKNQNELDNSNDSSASTKIKTILSSKKKNYKDEKLQEAISSEEVKKEPEAASEPNSDKKEKISISKRYKEKAKDKFTEIKKSTQEKLEGFGKIIDNIAHTSGEVLKKAATIIFQSAKRTVSYIIEASAIAFIISEKNPTTDSEEEEKTTDYVLRLAKKEENSELKINTLHLTMLKTGLEYDTLHPKEKIPVKGFISYEQLKYGVNPNTTIGDFSKPENIDAFFNIYEFICKEGHFYKHTSLKDKVKEQAVSDPEILTEVAAVNAIIHADYEAKKAKALDSSNNSQGWPSDFPPVYIENKDLPPQDLPPAFEDTNSIEPTHEELVIIKSAKQSPVIEELKDAEYIEAPINFIAETVINKKNILIPKKSKTNTSLQNSPINHEPELVKPDEQLNSVQELPPQVNQEAKQEQPKQEQELSSQVNHEAKQEQPNPDQELPSQINHEAKQEQPKQEQELSSQINHEAKPEQSNPVQELPSQVNHEAKQEQPKQEQELSSQINHEAKPEQSNPVQELPSQVNHEAKQEQPKQEQELSSQINHEAKPELSNPVQELPLQVNHEAKPEQSNPVQELPLQVNQEAKQEQPKQEQELPLQVNQVQAQLKPVENEYWHSTVGGKKGRSYHFFDEVNTSNRPEEFQAKYRDLKGDYLKTAILENFKTKINDAHTLKEFKEAKREILNENNEGTKILKQKQGCFFSFFKIETTSMDALNKMLKDRENQFTEVQSDNEKSQDNNFKV